MPGYVSSTLNRSSRLGIISAELVELGHQFLGSQSLVETPFRAVQWIYDLFFFHRPGVNRDIASVVSASEETSSREYPRCFVLKFLHSMTEFS